MTIYTLGYSGWKIEDVARLVDRLDAILVDVRLSPRSRNPVFSGKRLTERFGDRYIWLRGFGNVNYRQPDAPVRLADFDGGLRRLCERMLQEDTNDVILLCACRDVGVCHRKVVADRLAETLGGKIIHLDLSAAAGQEGMLF